MFIKYNLNISRNLKKLRFTWNILIMQLKYYLKGEQIMRVKHKNNIRVVLSKLGLNIIKNNLFILKCY